MARNSAHVSSSALPVKPGFLLAIVDLRMCLTMRAPKRLKDLSSLKEEKIDRFLRVITADARCPLRLRFLIKHLRENKDVGDQNHRESIIVSRSHVVSRNIAIQLVPKVYAMLVLVGRNGECVWSRASQELGRIWKINLADVGVQALPG